MRDFAAPHAPPIRASGRLPLPRRAQLRRNRTYVVSGTESYVHWLKPGGSRRGVIARGSRRVIQHGLTKLAVYEDEVRAQEPQRKKSEPP